VLAFVGVLALWAGFQFRIGTSDALAMRLGLFGIAAVTPGFFPSIYLSLFLSSSFHLLSLSFLIVCLIHAISFAGTFPTSSLSPLPCSECSALFFPVGVPDGKTAGNSPNNFVST
jgi:hypothetical protein